MAFFDHVTEDYGVDLEGFEVEEEDTDVIVPECSFALTADYFQQLQVTVNPLAESDNCGIELHENTVRLFLICRLLICKQYNNASVEVTST